MEDSGYKNESEKLIADLENQRAVLDCWNKTLTLMFRDEIHVVNLREGDLDDNWNGVTIKKSGEVFDFNFGWEYIDKDNIEDDVQPWMSLYATYEDEDGELRTDHSDDYSFIVYYTNGRQYAYYHENLEVKPKKDDFFINPKLIEI